VTLSIGRQYGNGTGNGLNGNGHLNGGSDYGLTLGFAVGGALGGGAGGGGSGNAGAGYGEGRLTHNDSLSSVAGEVGSPMAASASAQHRDVQRLASGDSGGSGWSVGGVSGGGGGGGGGGSGDSESSLGGGGGRSRAPRHKLRKRLTLSPEEVARLGLRPGKNVIAFSFSSRVWGRQVGPGR